ncbi:testis-expressed protein 9-like [Mytilus californianus]|uniref:testis-expressed protein 9-like n=1 Tax=Mytilus californianus TaxID=6549 RepID=UPI0022476734|nr:testis-expressed protein 9-like [Mytilus californianus]
MAESFNNIPGSRTNSAKNRPGSGRKPGSGVKNTNISGGGSILSKEEEYKRLNDELEARTANLVKEAEEVLQGQEKVLSESRLLDNINADDFLKDYDDDTEPNTDRSHTDRPSSKTGSRTSSKVTNHTRPHSTNQSRPPSKVKRPTSGKPLRPKSGKSNLADNVAVPDDTFMTQFRDFNIDKTVSNIEGQIDRGQVISDEDDDVIPQAANEMGAEATIRFLKAKLRVMQEELDRLGSEVNKRDDQNKTLSVKIKEMEDERGRLYRTTSAQQAQIDKFKKISEDAQVKSDTAESQLAGLRKELDQMKRSQKQQTSTNTATEVRLNRALEEIEKYKEQLLRAKSSSKESTDHDRKRTEQLLADNKRLEKQKNELMAGFKKQLKLIDILKRQKMHIEAAKMLSFSEEEFVKALEWGS